jgi:UDP-glucose:(heptosyl)LPS alpha-1,3-glucosyltransferase
VVGRDREEARFARQARAAGLSGRVRFLGGRDDVRPLYAAADCFILPSRYDPFPNTVLEALAMGLPAIVSSRCGAAEIVEPGANGWVCEPDDAPGIARLMQAADGAIRDGRMARAARSTAERFGIEAMAGKLAELYVSIDERR